MAVRFTAESRMMECAEMFFGHATHALARKKAE